MIRKTLTILSLIGLLLSVGLWVISLARTGTNFTLVSGIEKERHELWRRVCYINAEISNGGIHVWEICQDLNSVLKGSGIFVAVYG